MTLIRTTIPKEAIMMGVDIDHDTNTGKVSIAITIESERMKISEISEKSGIPLEKVRTSTKSVPMIKIAGNRIDHVHIFEL